MKIFRKCFPLCLLMLVSVWLLFRFNSTPHEKCIKQQQEIRYSLKPIFLNASTINNIEISPTPIPWPKTVMTPKNFTQTLNFVIVFHSAVENFKRRSLIRQQFSVYLQQIYHFRIIFAVGSSDKVEIQKRLEEEAKMFGDILQNYSLDFYKNLTIKAVSWISFIAQYWSKINYVVKIDDDVSVNLKMLMQFLNQQNDKNKAVFCSPMKQIADRRKHSKWYLSYNEFPYRNLGIFCAGLSYVFTADLLPIMQENLEIRRFVWLDDWYVTHALLAHVDFTLYDTDDLYFSSEISSGAFRKLRQIMTFKRLIPVFTHLRPRRFLDFEKQNQLWKYSQPCRI